MQGVSFWSGYHKIVVAPKEDQGVVVICPKCKVKLKVADEKIAPAGTRFKCPKCSTVLLVKKPAPLVRPLNENMILAAHEDPSVLKTLETVLTASGYKVIAASDGIAAMVNATKELPFLGILGVSLPKIYGFEVCRRLKSRPETKNMKFILVASIYDQTRYRREPESLHGADSYIEAHDIETVLLERINALKGVPEKVPSPESERLVEEKVKTGEMPSEKTPASEEIGRPTVRPQASSANDAVEKARRLARTILSDIYLYGKSKVDNSIRNNSFHSTFASELKEGLKLYESRISAEVRASGDFFNEAVNNFIEKRKKDLT